MKLLLLGTSGCHLCEDAKLVVNKCIENQSKIQVEHIDIAQHERWQQTYATLIPVLLHEKTSQTLNWPFVDNQVINFFESIKS